MFQDLPLGIKCQEIKTQLRTLYRQHGVVSKKTMGKILDKESLCQAELGRIGEIQNELAVALSVCRGSRQELDGAKKKFTSKSLGILKNFKRKQVIYQLLSNLKTIRTLVSSIQKKNITDFERSVAKERWTITWAFGKGGIFWCDSIATWKPKRSS